MRDVLGFEKGSRGAGRMEECRQSAAASGRLTEHRVAGDKCKTDLYLAVGPLVDRGR